MAEHDDMDFDYGRARSFPLSDAERSFDDDFLGEGLGNYEPDDDLFADLIDDAANDNFINDLDDVERDTAPTFDDLDADDDELPWEETPPEAFLHACQRQLSKGPQGDVSDEHHRTPAQAVLRAGGNRDRGPSYLL
jgi:hypothetical protein